MKSPALTVKGSISKIDLKAGTVVVLFEAQDDVYEFSYKEYKASTSAPHDLPGLQEALFKLARGLGNHF